MSINGMHMFLLHPAVFIRKTAGMYSSMHQGQHARSLPARRVIFAARPSGDLVENNSFVLCVISRLMRHGCKLFVRNAVVRRPAGTKPGVHCDLIGYQKKSNTFFLLSYAKKTTQLRQTFVHSQKFREAMLGVVDRETTLKSIVVPLDAFEESTQILFRTKLRVSKAKR